MVGLFEDLCRLQVAEGMDYKTESIQADEIRKQANYAGIRVSLLALLGNSRISIQVDIGYGDAVTPAPEEAVYPVLLDDLPAPKLRVYPMYTVVAEKFETLVSLGIANTRMKDYFDLWVLHQQGKFDNELLRTAIAETFLRRGKPLPKGVPVGLSDEFSGDVQKQRQWLVFLKKNQLAQLDLGLLIVGLRAWLMPLIVK